MSFSRVLGPRALGFPSLLQLACVAGAASACSSSVRINDDSVFPADGGTEDGGDRDADPDSDATTRMPTLADWADLRADVNRDGRVTLEGEEDDALEDSWTESGGAVFLANIDDDSGRCPKEGSDEALAACHDAADEVVNGEADLLDLARVHIAPRPGAPEGIEARLDLGEHAQRVRMFVRRDEGFEQFGGDTRFTSADLRAGVEIAVEARDIVRDADVWDGFVDLTLVAKLGDDSHTDRVRLRVAPLLTSHHLQPATHAYASDTQTSDGEPFLRDLEAAVSSAKLPGGLTRISTDDQWAQDFFETAYMSMPGAGGKQHVIEVAMRSSNQYRGDDGELRQAGRFVYTQFRGKDRAGLTQRSNEALAEADSLNSYGNLETIPPYSLGDQHFPMGRILRGSSADFYPDPSMTKLLDSQLQQPAINVDTSWLLVGHVDETLSFVKAKNPRGWVMLVNDPRLARTMLEEQAALGNGAVELFTGKRSMSWFGLANISIDELLADADVMGESARSAAAIDMQVSRIVEATGLSEAEIVRVPYLHQPASGLSLAYQPGTVNGIYLADGVFAAPDPHGPVIDGKDIFKVQLESAIAAHGIEVKWVEDWNLYHIAAGEVHCGSNTRRRPTNKWWESGR
jgi:protein-arginine deiminase